MHIAVRVGALSLLVVALCLVSLRSSFGFALASGYVLPIIGCHHLASRRVTLAFAGLGTLATLLAALLAKPLPAGTPTGLVAMSASFAVLAVWTTAGMSMLQQRTRAELRECQAYHGAIFETAVDGIIVIDRQGRIESVNPAATRMFGYAKGELVGQPIACLMPPPLAEAHDGYMARYLAGGPKRIIGVGREVVGRRKDGAEFPLYLGISEVKLPGQHVFLGILRDITDRKRHEDELHDYARRLEASNRELDEFAAIASHDLQEPLRKIIAFGERLAQVLGPRLSSDELDYLQRMTGAATRMQQLIAALLTYSRITTKAQPFVEVDLNLVVAEVLSDLELRIEQLNAAISVGELPRVWADPLQMRQLYLNLIGNALKFHRQGVRPSVAVRGATTDGDRCELTVADNGIGFDEKDARRIFILFERLHGRAAYEGTGIGLALCKKIIERHGGEITARSRLGEGSMFIVRLPRQRDQASASAPPA